MKWLAALLVLLPSIVWGQMWIPANQKTIGWDAVTTLQDGSAIPSGNSISYKVYRRPELGTETEVATTTNTNYTITFSVEGKYFIGVKSLRLDSSGAQLSESLVSWSNDPAVVAAGTFGIIYYLGPFAPRGLR